MMPCNPHKIPASARKAIAARHHTQTSTEIGLVLGVSGSTVRCWARAMGLRCRWRSARSAPVVAHMARVRWIFDMA